jgi:hypothetical protein
VCCVLQVRSFIDDAYKRTVGLLRERKDLVDKMAQVCLCGRGRGAVWDMLYEEPAPVQVVRRFQWLPLWGPQPVAGFPTAGRLMLVRLLPLHRMQQCCSVLLSEALTVTASPG